LAERNLAERVALLLGADRVDVKRISICAPSAAKEAARLDNSTLSDDRIRHAVILALELNPWIVRLPEKVEVRGGVVEISGEVESLAEKEAVKRMAERIVGVACVNENLRVRPGKKIDDRELARRAISALRRDAQLGDSKIDVSVINGKVFLTGSLEAPHRKAHAERLVGRIHGVIEISSRVTPQIGAASSSI
jgi:osmotically-inducible protein OsmY